MLWDCMACLVRWWVRWYIFSSSCTYVRKQTLMCLYIMQVCVYMVLCGMYANFSYKILHTFLYEYMYVCLIRRWLILFLTHFKCHFYCHIYPNLVLLQANGECILVYKHKSVAFIVGANHFLYETVVCLVSFNSLSHLMTLLDDIAIDLTQTFSGCMSFRLSTSNSEIVTIVIIIIIVIIVVVVSLLFSSSSTYCPFPSMIAVDQTDKPVTVAMHEYIIICKHIYEFKDLTAAINHQEKHYKS